MVHGHAIDVCDALDANAEQMDRGWSQADVVSQ